VPSRGDRPVILHDNPFVMSATTIKLDADLVKKVASLKPRDESISVFVGQINCIKAA